MGLKDSFTFKKDILDAEEKKKFKVKKNKYNDNYNEIPSTKIFDDITRYWTYLFNLDWSIMDPEFNRDSICELNSLA